MMSRLSIPLSCVAAIGAIALVACGGASTDGSSSGGSSSGGSSSGGSSSGGSSSGGSSSGGVQGGAIQMNDVSILLPLPQSVTENDAYLKPSTAGRGGVLLPQSLYDAATGEDQQLGPAPGGAGPMPYADLRLVAMRLDPCFANIGPVIDPSSCQNQLRVIFQDVETTGDGPIMTLDSGVHAFYSLTRGELVDMVNAIGNLRAASGGTSDLGALQPHPIVVKEGISGPFGSGLMQLVTAHAGAANLIRFTRFQSSGPQWTFSGFDIADAAGGAFTPMQIPKLDLQSTTGTSPTQVTFFAGFSGNDDIQGQFTPTTTSTDDMQLLANQDAANAATQEQRQAAWDAALRIENPAFESPNTIDCASCHVSGPAREVIGVRLGMTTTGDANAFSIASKWVPDADLNQTTDLDPPTDSFDVHVFSYKESEPTIAPRVINETALVVDYLNGLR